MKGLGEDLPPMESPHDALVKAEAAIERLESLDEGSRGTPRAVAAGVVAVSALSLAGLVVHTFFEDGAPKVDQTSVLLLIVLLLAPIVPRLRAFELGGVKAEWREDAVAGLREVTAVVRAQHNALTGIYDDMVGRGQPSRDQLDGAAGGALDGAEPDAEATDEAPGGIDEPQQRMDEPSDWMDDDQSRAWGGTHGQQQPPVLERRPEPSRVDSQPPPRVLWVDDRPEGNFYELESLRRLVPVTTATTTEEALEAIRTGHYGAVISDIVRMEVGNKPVLAGQQLIEALRAMGSTIPVLIYDFAAAGNRSTLMRVGAEVVTGSFSDIVAALRRHGLLSS